MKRVKIVKNYVQKGNIFGFNIMSNKKDARLIGVAPITQYTHVCNINSNTHWISHYVVKVIFHSLRNCS